MPLNEYRKKRSFLASPEPPGKERSSRKNGRLFVVQKHHATSLHYDFRLEIAGVLVSWAVPKGPSLNPAEKRLAVMTEDHPMEYAGFEGTIPEGLYGAGTVMVWDTGEYEPDGDVPMDQQLKRGELKFTLNGRKLRGGFVLVHSGARSEDPKQQKRWLLIKHRDQAADPHWDIDRADVSRSVISGHHLEEIAVGRPVRKRRGNAA